VTKERVKKMLVVAGGSGGHIFPAIGFCQEMQSKYASSFAVAFLVFSLKGFSFSGEGLAPVCFKASKTLIGLLRLFWNAFFWVVVKNPSVIVGFGGYATVPFIVCGRILGKKVFIHEQNAVPGRANRFLGFWAMRIGVTFPGTDKFFNAAKVFLVRYPLRSLLQKVNRSEALKFFDFKDHLFTILVVGGSQGAGKINAVFSEALKINRHVHRMQVIHLCGSRDEDVVSRAYRDLSLRSRPLAFLKEMHFAYTAADLIIGRSGAGCVQEILFFGRPSILIPYPYALGHQKENARVLAEAGAALYFEEDELTAEKLSGLIDIFIDDHMRRKAMSAIASQMAASGAKMTMAELVVAS
jgi:UDP-N-acetylglucosamine--N-acetylmuramyl-(pentapeptide) pyrophosphoryl-undecaprenol N-acetylglucosamine transferase